MGIAKRKASKSPRRAPSHDDSAAVDAKMGGVSTSLDLASPVVFPSTVTLWTGENPLLKDKEALPRIPSSPLLAAPTLPVLSGLLVILPTGQRFLMTPPHPEPLVPYEPLVFLEEQNVHVQPLASPPPAPAVELKREPSVESHRNFCQDDLSAYSPELDFGNANGSISSLIGLSLMDNGSARFSGSLYEPSGLSRSSQDFLGNADLHLVGTGPPLPTEFLGAGSYFTGKDSMQSDLLPWSMFGGAQLVLPE